MYGRSVIFIVVGVSLIDVIVLIRNCHHTTALGGIVLCASNRDVKDLLIAVSTRALEVRLKCLLRLRHMKGNEDIGKYNCRLVQVFNISNVISYLTVIIIGSIEFYIDWLKYVLILYCSTGIFGTHGHTAS